MPLTAITRQLSPAINDCELLFHDRQLIDVPKAMAQHHSYQDCLRDLGVQLVCLPAAPDLPDAVFVEDTAVVLDEVAIIANMGAPSRRPEPNSMAEALVKDRPLEYITAPGILDGGDVLRIGRSIFVGLSQRTNEAAIRQVTQLVSDYDYQVQPVAVTRCLHLKSACSYIGRDTLLVNRSWIEGEPLRGFELLDVPPAEPAAANALLINKTVMLPASFHETRTLLEERGLCVRTVDVSELQKAEAGATCCSLIFDSKPIR